MELGDWQNHLEQHYALVRKERSSHAPGHPIFALEHGLNQDQLLSLGAEIRRHIQQGFPSDKHSLPWVVYASEFGYRFAGDEYWQTFEAETPGWTVFGDRYWIRDCFRAFQETYQGAIPTGPWAQHRSIICWPITHAILPCDLQQQFAHLLYSIRHLFTDEALASPATLGELIAEESWNASSRFQQLAEEPLLLGQIASALLLDGEDTSSSYLHRDTLLRISADLDRERQARTWFHAAKATARQRFQFLPSLGSGSGGGIQDTSVSARGSSSRHASIEPRLMLRPTVAKSWDVIVEFPDFSPAAAKRQKLKELLLSSRCRVNGSSGRPIPAGQFLRGSQKVKLRQWPRANEPLLKFEKPSAMLDTFATSECLLRPRRLWLFKVAADHLAYELKSPLVRPTNQYVLVVPENQALQTSDCLREASLECDGALAYSLLVPETISSELRDLLSAIDIGHVGTVSVWPAGLVPSQWDGEGTVEWLTTDIPCLGIQADHSVAEYSIDVGTQKFRVAPTSPDLPAFVQLPRLYPGEYGLGISALDDLGNVTQECTQLKISIREPRIWSPGTGNEAAFFMIVEPNRPSLEQFWEGSINIEAHGPASRKLHCDLTLLSRDGRSLCQRKMAPLPLPMEATKWRDAFHHDFRRYQDVQSAYDLADAIQARFWTDELGTYILTAHREFTPLRWAVTHNREGFRLRVLDDTGTAKLPTICRYDFSRPVNRHLLPPDTVTMLSSEAVAPGLYVVESGEFTQSVMVPPQVQTFQDMQIPSQLHRRPRTPEEIIDLINVMELWALARVTGNLLTVAMSMRRNAMIAILQDIFRIIAGDSWGAVEKAVNEGRYDSVIAAARKYLVTGHDIALADQLNNIRAELMQLPPSERAIRLSEIANRQISLPNDKRRGISDFSQFFQWHSEFALRLASGSKGVGAWAGERLHSGTSTLLQIPALARAARIMVLLLAETSNAAALDADLYENWTWQ